MNRLSGHRTLAVSVQGERSLKFLRICVLGFSFLKFLALCSGFEFSLNSLGVHV